MSKRRTDRQLADDIVAKLNSEEDKAAHPAMEITSLLQRARDAGGGALRVQYLETAQREIAKLDPSRHRKLINQLQGEVLALQGRRGDTRVAHVTPGEVVIPERLQTPELLAALRAAARQAGIDPARLVVGHRRNSINPNTGQAEFYKYNGEDIEEITVTAHRLGPDGINDPTTTNPTYDRFKFDPKAAGQRDVAREDPLAAAKGALNAAQAYAETWWKFPGGLKDQHNNAADAYRHARWNQLMTKSMGQGLAKKFADGHEIDRPTGDGSRLMDLHNNEVGRGLANGSSKDIEEALKKGLLRKSPFDMSE